MTSRVFNALLDGLCSPQAICASDTAALLAAGATSALAGAIGQAGASRLPDSVRRAVDDSLTWQSGDPAHHVLTRADAAYPTLLAQIPDPPPLLYVRGNADSLQLPQIAMVGSRRPSADGRRHARRFARELAEGGITVCSGLALGIDAESHWGALQGKGMTVAVLGTGIDIRYPPGNAGLYDRIVEQGALVSEFNPGTRPYAGNFPKRNRLISGLSVGVLVVEAGLKSGSMITARFALEQGRDVFAIPGSINNPMAWGCHQLIGNGARLVQSAAEVVTECGAVLGHVAAQAREGNGTAAPAQAARLSSEQERVMAAIGFDPVAFDNLVDDTGMDVAILSALLVELEIQGLVRRDAAGYAREMPD